MKKLLVFLAFLVLCPSLPSLAQEDWGEIRYAVRPLNVRADRDAGARRITTLKQGERVKVDFLKDDWYAVFRIGETLRKEKNAIGYAFGKYLKPVASANWGRIMMADRNLNVRTGRNGSFKHVKTLMKGDKVKVDFLKDEWYAVFDVNEKHRDIDKAIGYSIAKYLVPATGGRTAGGTATNDSAPSWGQHRYADRMLTVRKEPNPRSPHVRTLQKGEHVKVGDMVKGWYAIYRPGETDEKNIVGYSNGKYLLPAKKSYAPPAPQKTSKPAPAAAPDVASTTDAPAEKKPAPATGSSTAKQPASPPKPLAAAKKTAPDARPSAAATKTTKLPGVWGDIVSTPNKIILRKAPSPEAEESVILQKGELVKVDFEKGGWLAVFPINELKHSESRAIGWVRKSVILPPQKTTDEFSAFNEPASVQHAAREDVRAAQEPTAAPSPKAAPAPVAPRGKPEPVAQKTSPAAKTATQGKPSAQAAAKKATPQGSAEKASSHTDQKEGYRASVTSKDTVRTIPGTPKPVEIEKMSPPKRVESAERTKTAPVPKAAPETPEVSIRKPVSQGISMESRTESIREKSKDIHRDTRNPGTDEVRHGFRFKVLETREIRMRNERFYGIVVFVDLDTLPKSSDLEDFAKTIWKEHQRKGLVNQVNIYLPGIDRSGPSYAVGRFSENGEMEYWERRSVLFGTKFY